MKVALVHDWLFHMRGGEKVLEAIAQIYPEATIYTLFYDRAGLSKTFDKIEIRASVLQKLPGIKKYYRWLLPFLPWLIGTLKIDPDTQVVISSSHCVAKGIPIPKNAFHICYCHTPMRYIWGFEKDYFSKMPSFMRGIIGWISHCLRKWDIQVNTNVDQFIANSNNVKYRIKQFYNRESTVVYPPLDAKFYEPSGQLGDFYLVVSAFVPYKKIDLVIEAFNELDRPLFIVGSGPMEKTYRQLRRSEKITFLGAVSNAELKKLYAQAKALLFPTEEDFGIVPLEAQSSGTPVIAFGKGGALESVKSGVFFHEQSPTAIRQAVIEFEAKSFDRAQIPGLVSSFDRSCFQDQIKKLIASWVR